MDPLIPPDPALEARFVKHYLQTGDALDAYKRAGFLVHGYDERDVALYLLERSDIQLAIKAASEAKGGGPVEVTRDSLVTDLEKIYQETMLDRDFTPAIAAKKAQAHLLGMLEQTVNVTHRLDVKSMSDDELIRIINLKQKNTSLDMIDVTPVGVGIGAG